MSLKPRLAISLTFAPTPWVIVLVALVASISSEDAPRPVCAQAGQDVAKAPVSLYLTPAAHDAAGRP